MAKKKIINIKKLFLRHIKEYRSEMGYKLNAYSVIKKNILLNDDFWKRTGLCPMTAHDLANEYVQLSTFASREYKRLSTRTVLYEVDDEIFTKDVNTYKYDTDLLIRTVFNDFVLFLSKEVYKKEIDKEFELFLKKHGVYTLYYNCVAPYFIEHGGTNYTEYEYTREYRKYSKYGGPTKYKLTIDKLLPEDYFIRAFDWSHTIKSIDFWDNINRLWIEKLKTTIGKLSRNTVLVI